jgi:hypothetical protein
VDFVDAVGESDDEIDAAHHRKVRPSPRTGCIHHQPVARATTLKLVPRQLD